MSRNTGKIIRTIELPATIVGSDGPPGEATAIITTEAREFQIHGHIEVDFEKLRASGDLEAGDLHTLQHGYPNGIILFMGVSRGSHDDKPVCIGIKTGPHVYPKNMFFIRVQTALDACTALDEPPHEVKPF